MRFAALWVIALAACTFAPLNGNGGGGAAGHDASMPHDDGHAPDGHDGALPDAAASLAVVQHTTAHKAGTEGNPVTSVTATFMAPPAAGHLLLLFGGNDTTVGDSVSGVGSGWTMVSGSWADVDVEMWYAVATGSGTEVTLSYPPGADDMFIGISEWTGLDTASPVNCFGPPNGTNADGNANTDARGGPITTTASDVIVVAVSSETSTEPDTPPGLTEIDDIQGSDYTSGAWYEVEPTPASYNPGVLSPGRWDATVVAFKVQD